jgi:hypothetical protein
VDSERFKQERARAGRRQLKKRGNLMAMAETEESIPLSSVIYACTPPYFIGLIDHVLVFRSEASSGVRKALDAEIDKCIKLHGFSRHPSWADANKLRGPILEEIKDGNSKLTGEVLRTWVESQKVLKDLVERQLQHRNIPVDGPNRRDGVFKSHWRMNDWKEVVDTISDDDPKIKREDVRMMVCYVSGMAERLDVTSQPLSDCVNSLRRIDIEDSGWQDIDDFISIVQEIADSKALQRIEKVTERCVSTLQQAQQKFYTELQYLELDIAGWEERASETPAAITTALKLAEELQGNLEAYQDVRPQAESKTKEAERRQAREQRELAIKQVVDEWEGIFVAEVDEHKSKISPSATDVPQESVVPAEEQADPKSRDDENQDLRNICQRLRKERDSYRSENYRLHSENKKLGDKHASIVDDRQSLDSENKKLRAKLSENHDLGGYWQHVYAATEQLENVDDAVSRAKDQFSKQLGFALNSKSDKDSPFKKPEEVFAALAWLATEYHYLRWASAGEEPRFAERLRKFCSGWFYKPRQKKITKQQYPEWYTTDFHGHSYELVEHLGKGTSADPQTTIRIAFAWDEERNQVVVGYIGRHQRSRRS